MNLRLPSPVERNLVAQDGETLPTPCSIIRDQWGPSNTRYIKQTQNTTNTSNIKLSLGPQPTDVSQDLQDKATPSDYTLKEKI